MLSVCCITRHRLRPLDLFREVKSGHRPVDGNWNRSACSKCVLLDSVGSSFNRVPLSATGLCLRRSLSHYGYLFKPPIGITGWGRGVLESEPHFSIVPEVVCSQMHHDFHLIDRHKHKLSLNDRRVPWTYMFLHTKLVELCTSASQHIPLNYPQLCGTYMNSHTKRANR